MLHKVSVETTKLKFLGITFFTREETKNDMLRETDYTLFVSPEHFKYEFGTEKRGKGG